MYPNAQFIRTIRIQPHKIYKKQKNNRVIQTSLSRIFFHSRSTSIPRAKNFSHVRPKREKQENREITRLYRRETFEIKIKRLWFVRSEDSIDRSSIVLLVRRWKIGERGGKGNGRAEQQVRVEELLDPKGCNNGRRGGIERNSPSRFYSGASPIGESQYKGGTDRLENRCIAITSHFSFYHFFFLLPPSLLFSSSFFLLSPIWRMFRVFVWIIVVISCSRKDKELLKQFGWQRVLIEDFCRAISTRQGKRILLTTKKFSIYLITDRISC